MAPPSRPRTSGSTALVKDNNRNRVPPPNLTQPARTIQVPRLVTKTKKAPSSKRDNTVNQSIEEHPYSSLLNFIYIRP